MNKDHVFLKQYNAQIAFTLECFDRVIFKGYLRQLSYPAGLNPACSADLALFQILCQGHFLLHGFVNRDVRQQLFPAAADDPGQRRRACAG